VATLNKLHAVSIGTAVTPPFKNPRLKRAIGILSLGGRKYYYYYYYDRLCGLVVRVLGYRSGGPGSIPGTTKKKVMGLERGPLSLVSTTEELLDRKVAAPV
jgi:hypothetical protein